MGDNGNEHNGNGHNGNGSNGKRKHRGKLVPPFQPGISPNPEGRKRGRPSFRLACMRAIDKMAPDATLEDRRRVLDAMVERQVAIALHAIQDRDATSAFKTLAHVVDGNRIKIEGAGQIVDEFIRSERAWVPASPVEAGSNGHSNGGPGSNRLNGGG